ncbi:hypothetical protein D3C72_1410610 [compost metagenome]
MRIGRGRGLQQRVVALHGLELVQIASGHGEFMRIKHRDGTVVAAELGQRIGLWGLQQQMVAVHVDAVGGGAPARGSAIGIGARHQQDIELVEQRRKRALREGLRHGKQGFAAGRLVTVLLADQQYRWAPAGVEIVQGGAGGARKQQCMDGGTFLRGTGRDQLGLGSPGRC